MRVLSEVRQWEFDEGQHPDGAARDGMRRRLAARRFITAEPEHHARVHLQAALNVAGPVRCSWLFRMIAKLGSAARAAGSLAPDSDLEELARFGRAVGPGRCSLACYGDEARAQRKTPAAAEPGGRSLGELASYLKRLPDTESEL